MWLKSLKMKKIKSKNINLNFTNRFTYIFISFIIILLIGISVFAFGTSDPPTFGHSAGELDLSEGVEGDAVFLGNLDVAGRVKMGTSVICDANEEGSLRYNSVDKKIEYCNSTDWNLINDPEYGWVYIGQESKLTGFGSCYQNVHHTITCDAVWDGKYMYGDRDTPYNPDRTDCPTCNFGHYGEVFGTAGPGIRVYVSTHTSHSYPYHDYNGIQGPNYGVTLPLYGLSWNEPNVISGGYDAVLSEDDKILETWKGDTCGSDGSQMTMVDIYECQVIN